MFCPPLNPPAGGGLGRGAVTVPAETRRGRAARDPRPYSSRRCARIAWTAGVNMGEPGFPIPPPAGGSGPQARGVGKRGFSTPPPAGGSGKAEPSQEEPFLEQGDGETAFPHPPARWQDSARGRKAMGGSPGHRAATGGKAGYAGGHASPHSIPSTAHIL